MDKDMYWKKKKTKNKCNNSKNSDLQAHCTNWVAYVLWTIHIMGLIPLNIQNSVGLGKEG